MLGCWDWPNRPIPGRGAGACGGPPLWDHGPHNLCWHVCHAHPIWQTCRKQSALARAPPWLQAPSGGYRQQQAGAACCRSARMWFLCHTRGHCTPSPDRKALVCPRYAHRPNVATAVSVGGGDGPCGPSKAPPTHQRSNCSSGRLRRQRLCHCAVLAGPSGGSWGL